MLEDAPVLEMPPRSRLYSLPMAGTCGATQEGLLDYAQRLSALHCVKVRRLFADEILPETNLKSALYASGHLREKSVYGCSGLSMYAFEFLGAMERLTGRTDLANGTLTQWAGLLGERGCSTTQRRWCAHCLGEQTERGYFSYSLLWSLNPVLVCPIHRTRLSDRCGHCGESQPIIGDAHVRGQCWSCHAPLSQARGLLATEDVSSKDLYIADAVAGMIALGKQATTLAEGWLFQARLREAAALLFGGTVRRLESQLNLASRALDGGQRYSLRNFLEIMHRLGVSPVEFLDGSTAPKLNVAAVSQKNVASRKTSASELAGLLKRVEEHLEVALQDRQHITTRRFLAGAVGMNEATLYYQFPELVRKLSEHNARIRPQIHQEKWRQSGLKISAAMQRLVDQGGHHSGPRMSRAMIEVGLSWRHPEVRKLAKEELARLRALQTPA